MYPRDNKVPVHVHDEAIDENDITAKRNNLEDMGIDEPERLTIPEDAGYGDEYNAQDLWYE